MRTTAQNNKKIKQYVDQNPVEAIRGIGAGVASSIKTDVVAGSIDTMWKQFLGAETGRSEEDQFLSGDLIPGSEVSLTNITQKAREEARSFERQLPALDYHREVRTAEVRIVRENEVELAQKITQIQIELRKLIKSSKELETTFKQVTVEQAPQRSGRYHLNFVEWLFSVVKTARMRVDESKNWLSVLFAKRAKRQYWSMFKKHGTTFGLSGERVVATQTG